MSECRAVSVDRKFARMAEVASVDLDRSGSVETAEAAKTTPEFATFFETVAGKRGAVPNTELAEKLERVYGWNLTNGRTVLVPSGKGFDEQIAQHNVDAGNRRQNFSHILTLDTFTSREPQHLVSAMAPAGCRYLP
jgi:hypothetical protein